MHRTLCFELLLSAGLLTLISGSAPAITTAPSWKPRETVDTSTYYAWHAGADRMLAYDHFGNPGIAFFDPVNFDLRYAVRGPGVGWVSSVVDATGTAGLQPSLAYDRYERPAISYFESASDDLRYAHYSGSAWQIETVDATGVVGTYSSLAFDLLGRPAIAYRDDVNTSLKYVADTDGDFSLADETPVTVVNDFGEGEDASLVFDPLNRPMIAHFDSINADLRFSVELTGVGWVTTTVDSTGSAGDFPSIAIDPDSGHPAIAYQGNSGADLRYAAWNGDSWNLETVDSGNVGYHPSLAFDPADGNPAISYFDSVGDDLKIAWHDGSSWQTQLVDTVGDVGLVTSLAFNDYGTGFPAISYFDVNSNLFFIEDPPAVPEPSSLVLMALGVIVVWLSRYESNELC